MKVKSKSTFYLTIIIIVLMVVAMFTSTSGNSFFSVNGIWSILPPLIAISLAFVTHNVVISLLIGSLIGAFLLSINGFNVFGALTGSFIVTTETMLDVAADRWNAGIIMQVLAIGGLISLVTHLGGARAIAFALSKRAKGPISTQVVTWLLGIFIFFDDYANSLIVGPMMRPVTDKNLVSREKLSFIIDATAAPIAGIALISTWVGAEISYIREGLSLASISDVIPYNLFVTTIPFRFYNILMLFFVLISALTLKDFGPMLRAEKRARSGQVRSKNDSNDLTYTKIEDEQSGEHDNIWYAILPIGILIVATIIGFYLNGRNAILGGEDSALINVINGSPLSFDSIRECFGASDASIVLFQSALLAGIITILFGAFLKKFTLSEGIEIWISGVKMLIITAIILILAWSLSSTVKQLGTATFLVNALSGSIPTWILPSIIFILGAIISFATGTSYGTMAILMPLCIPFAAKLAPDNYHYLVICSSAVLTSAIFGDHCSPISDTTILSSMGASCEHMDHVNTQMPYAIVVAVICLIFGYIPLGFGISNWIAMPISLLVVFAVLYFIGKTPLKEDFKAKKLTVKDIAD